MLLQITLDINITLGIVLAIIGSVCLNLGKGVQRIGAETLGKEMLKKWKTNPEDKKKIILWLVGTAMTALSMVFSMAAAFFLDRPSTAVALSGVGILSVVLFSFYVIKEKVSGLQVLAIILIILGTLVLGFDYPEAVKPLPNAPFYIYMAIITLIGTVIAIISMKIDSGQGFVFGAIAGFFNGFSYIASIFATSTGDNEILKSLANIWLVVGILLGQGAFWTTQYAFKKGGQANVVVPVMSSFVILIPFISDFLIYQVPFGAFQFFSFALNIAGIILLSISSSTALNRVMSSKKPIEIHDDARSKPPTEKRDGT